MTFSLKKLRNLSTFFTFENKPKIIKIMLQRIIIAFILISFFNISFSQSVYITKSLRKVINEKTEKEKIPILVVMNEQLDYESIKLDFDNQNLTSNQRAQETLKLLHYQQETKQKTFVENLKSELKNEVEILHQYWICNMILIEIQIDAIEKLQNKKEIKYLENANDRIIFDGELTKGTETKAENGTEPGLLAINAPAMWELGYTGKGTVVYDYDTGVWPNHPAFAKRFLANYFPQSQCWYGYYSEVPTGEYNSHGTHTLGTMIGLDTLTHDTIGVAFNAYWIANDLVRGTVEELPPISDMVLAFEWALDPDQNPETVYDIPDVINNSWRWYDGNDNEYCEGFVVDMLQSLSLAGIATLFSGGNSGPNNQTVNSPQRTKINLVNSFCVGAVDGNNLSFPIASFSTRGPSQCTTDEALEIHPEVVAPGVNVRSAYGSNGYSFLNGTSMSCPHVSGAVLLLKEAFPYLTGEKLLESLYFSAIDLGEEGEDNVFGRGIIDVYQAYLYLCENYTPVSPEYEYDLEIGKINFINCNQIVELQIEIINKGIVDVNDFSVDFYFDNQFIEKIPWNGNLSENQTVIINFSPHTIENQGEYELSFVVKNENFLNEIDSLNNKSTANYKYYSPQIPFEDGFEDGEINICWEQEYISGNSIWYCNNGGLISIPAAAYEGNFNAIISGSVGNKTKLILPKMDLTQINNPALSFWYALPTKFGFIDALSVYYKNDENNDWTMVTELTQQKDDWTFAQFQLPETSENYQIAFEALLNNGRGVALDFINIDEYVEISELMNKEKDFSIFPNPFNNYLIITKENLKSENIEISIKDITGEVIYNDNKIIDVQYILNLSDINSGIYFLEIKNNNKIFVEKIVKY